MDADPIIGTNVAGYAIESVLGHGAMGVVYVARQDSPARRVALKLIAPAFADDDVFRRRFLREATAAAAIEHPHILPVYAAGESNGILFMATRLIDGQDLGEILRGSNELPLERVARIIRQIGEALDAAHARGLVHRDVKPGNVLVTHQPDGEDADFCYLTDFGVSTWTASSAATITMTGQMVGTASYVARQTCTRSGACCTSASPGGHRSAVGRRRGSCTPTCTRIRRPRARSAGTSQRASTTSRTALSGKRPRSATRPAAS